MRRLSRLLLAIILPAGCVVDEPLLKDSGDCREVFVARLDFDDTGRTRSSIWPDESAVHDVNVFVFCNGLLADDVYMQDAADLELELYSDSVYDIYAVANMGDADACIDKDEFVSTFRYEMESLSGMDDVVPMRWSMEGIRPESDMPSVPVNFSRIVSKVCLSVDRSLLDGLEIRSVRLCQSPLSVTPFAAGGSKAESIDQVADGDYASDEDLEILNNGGSISLFTMENCQGILLPGNTDPFLKVPDRIEMQAGLCTYMEVSCGFGSGSLLTGNTVYRFYLGLDNCTDFNVPGNSVIDVQLVPTDAGLDLVSWKVASDVVAREGLVRGRPVSSRYALDDLYVGEVFEYQLIVTPLLSSFYDGDITECKLVFFPASGKDKALVFGAITKESLSFSADVQCCKPGIGSVWLCRPDGRKLIKVHDEVVVKLPEVALSDLSSVDDSYVFSRTAESLYCTINGTKGICYVYLVDQQGYNLNASSADGFNLRWFDFTGISVESDYGITETLSCTIQRGLQRPGAYSYVIKTGCGHDGTDNGLKEALTDAYLAEYAFMTAFEEKNFGLTCDCSWILDIPMIEVTFVDNGWAGLHDCQISVKVDNPSGLPLDISVWQVNTSDDSWNAISRNEILDYVESELDVRRVQCMAETYCKGLVPLYGAGNSFRCDSGCGTAVFPLSSVNTSDIHNALLYDKRGQLELCHMVDVSIGGSRMKSPSVSAVNSLSDGSALFDAVYGTEGWNDKGIWVFSDRYPIYSPYGLLDSYREFTPLSLDGLVEFLHGEVIDLNFSCRNGVLYVDSYEGGMKHLMLDMDFTITAGGYVKTYPKGTLGALKHNFCTEVITGSVSDIPLMASSGIVAADGGLLKQAMDAVYANTYPNSDAPTASAGSYQHHAHLVSLDCEIRVRLSGTSDHMLYPVTVRCDTDELSIYHEQDAKYYGCAFSTDVPFDEFVVVDKK